MSILDRYILRSLVVNYLIALAVMMSLYIVLDLFFNMDEFTEGDQGVAEVVADVVGYYATNLFLYFAQLSGVITLVACAATLARMRRANELTAMLASGVSLYRVAAPVLGFGLATTVLWVLDTEVAIPRVAARLARSHDDARGEKTYGVWFLRDRDGALLSAQQFLPGSGVMRRVMIMKLDDRGTVKSVIEAEEAMWEKLIGHHLGGRWVLTDAWETFRPLPDQRPFASREHSPRERVQFYESDLDPAKIQVRQSAQWIDFLSSSQLSALGRRELPPALASSVQQARHRRFVAPIINLVMLLLGIPFLLDRAPGAVAADISKCLAVCGICFAFAFVGQNVLRTDSYSALPAWLPIIVFTPLAVVLVDRIRT
ncbi:MAG: LptF/LptG family permease [Planctomycetes bacterium]|nr:LptF/LptG family permease [Planctomycetota bacterium]